MFQLPQSVYVLSHTVTLPNEDRDEWKLLGVYWTKEEAVAAVERFRRLPGFRDWPDGFVTDRYEVGRDQWSEGFVRVP